MAVKYLQAQHPNVAAELARRNLVNAKGMWFTALSRGLISLDQYRREIGELEQLERKGDEVALKWAQASAEHKQPTRF